MKDTKEFKNTVIHGDCLDKLKELEDNSVDAVVTDPPYGLSFMGKKWDYDVPSIEIWEEDFQKLIKHDFNNCAAHSEGQYCCLDIEHKRNKQIMDFIKEIKEQAKKEERERIKDKIGNIFNCLSDIDEYTDKMAIERMFKIWESL